MTISAEVLTEFIREAQSAYDDVQEQLRLLAERQSELGKQRDEIAEERDAFIASLERRFPDTKVPQADVTKYPLSFEVPVDDWSNLSRSDVVERVVKQLTEEKGFATPAEIESILDSKNRADTRDAIGAALAYLNRSHKVHSVKRAQWIHGAGA